MPACSTCGLAVDWLRSCYSSRWFLFAGDGSPSIAGRYYFSPDNTPFFPQRHWLGSRNWQDRNWIAAQGLGEDLSATQSYDDGQLPAVIPDNLVVGSADCITNGEAPTSFVPSGDLVNGFVPGCFVPRNPPATTFEEASDYQSCSIQFASARIIEWLYGGNVVSIHDYLTGFLGTTWTQSYRPPTPLLPSVYTAVSAAGTIVYVDGTVNFQEFALQAAYSLVPPQNLGIFATSTFWYSASSYIHAILTSAGADGTKPIFFCGHSYGAVAALLLAARYRAADPDRVIKYLTFGCPRVGDDRLVGILRECEGLSLCNDDDIVASIPPDYTTLFPIFVALGAPILLVWPFWKPAPLQAMMNELGQITLGGIPILDFGTLSAFAVDVLSSVPYPEIRGHGIEHYRSRIYARCSAPEWPLDAGDYTKLLADDFILLEIGDPILLENGDPILLEF